jgi:predicted RNase H-like nuclease (RuvC/YqgF family)
MYKKNVLNEIPTISETMKRNDINYKTEHVQEQQNVEETDVNVLSGDNKVDVDIEPDVKSNDVNLQLCSFSLVLNCCTSNSTATN